MSIFVYQSKKENPNGQPPKQKQIYKEINIGVFWNHVKQGNYKDCLPLLLQNEVLKKDYDKVQKLKETKKNK